MSTITSPAFKDNARAALGDQQLQRALSEVAPGLAARRSAARAGLPEFEALRDLGRDIKDHTLAHLDLYLEEFERKAARGRLHRAFRADGRGCAPHRARHLPGGRRRASSPRASR